VSTVAALSVDRCSIHDRRRLLEDYVLASKPVVIPDASEAWPARQRWTLEFFEREYGDVTTQAGGRDWRIADYIAQMRVDRLAPPLPYPFNFDMLERFPELIADLQPQPLFGRIDRLNHPLMWKSLLNGTRPHELFFGGSGSVFRQLHYDTLFLHGHITQILGDKEFYLYPPEQTPLMYPSAANPKLSAIDDPASPDPQRFPLFAQAQPYHALLRSGETIFFPSGWWHYTRIHGPCVAYGGVGLTAANWPNFIRDNYRHRIASGASRAKAGALLAYGSVVGALFNLIEATAPIA
jgi:histone arginine demethylase JMJD6